MNQYMDRWVGGRKDVPATLLTLIKPLRLQPSPFSIGPIGAGAWKPGWHWAACFLFWGEVGEWVGGLGRLGRGGDGG